MADYMIRTCGACPVQYEGETDGVAYYFRARGQRWRFGAGATPKEAVDVTLGWRDGFYREEPWGEEMYDAGYMPFPVAEEIIARCIEELRASRAA